MNQLNGLWLNTVRRALGMPQRYVASVLGVTKQQISYYERGEREGTITVANMRKVGDALGCDFVYTFRRREAGK